MLAALDSTAFEDQRVPESLLGIAEFVRPRIDDLNGWSGRTREPKRAADRAKAAAFRERLDDSDSA